MRISMKVRNPKFLKESIALNGDSYRSYADKVQLSYGYLSMVINQRKNVSPRTAKRIACGIHKEISDIFFTVSGHKSETNRCSTPEANDDEQKTKEVKE